MRVSDVGHVGDVPQVVAVSDHEWGLPFGDAGVDGREELRVSGAAEHGGSEGAGCHCAAVGFENRSFCRSLVREID